LHTSNPKRGWDCPALKMNKCGFQERAKAGSPQHRENKKMCFSAWKTQGI